MATWWWALGACAGSVDAPVDDSDAPALTAMITPARAWADTPLRCEAPGATSLTWLRDGAPADVTGPEVPVTALAPRQVWTCVATRGDDVAVASRRVDPPNVLVLIADDLGQGDVGFHGGDIATPALDRMAARGVVLDANYAAAPVCGPSRAGLLTGRQTARFGFEYNPDEPGAGIPPSEVLLPELLRDAGFATGAFGKWHLGVGPDAHPNQRGFDHFFGFLDGKRPSLPPGTPGAVEVYLDEDERLAWPLSVLGQPLQRDGLPVDPPRDRHLTDHVVDEAIAFVDASADDPWFAYVAFQQPHIPLVVSAEQLAAVPADPDLATWAYRASVHAVDAAIGRLLDHLDATGVGDHTLVVFTSDNGCPAGPVPCANGGLRGGKLTMMEGGLRVPTVVSWTGAWPGGRRLTDPTWSLDVVPTVLAATGAAPARAPLDGVDLGPWLVAPRADAPHDVLTWRMLPARAVRRGADKLVQAWGNTWRFDLAADPGELDDLHPDDPGGSAPLVELIEARADVLREAAWLGRWAELELYGVPVTLMF